MLASIAAWERRRIRDRTHDGRRRRAAEGIHVTGDPPFGHRVQRDARGKNPRLVINEIEAETVREGVRLLVDERMTTGQVVKRLNEMAVASAGKVDSDGTPLRRWLPRKADRWTPQHLRRAFNERNHTWGGEWRYQPFDAPLITAAIPAILSPERFAQLQERMASTSTGPRANKGTYLLGAGRLRCTCGAAMHGQLREPRASNAYRCFVQAREGRAGCATPLVHVDRVDGMVWTEIVALLTDEQRLAEIAGVAKARMAATGGSSESDLKALDRRIGRLEKGLATQVVDLVKAGVDAAAVGLATAQLNQDLATLKKQREKLVRWAGKNAATASRAATLVGLAERFRAAAESPTDSFRARVMDLLGIAVELTAFETCAGCEGRRLLPALPGKRGSRRCPDCSGFGRLPVLAISGLMPEASSLGDAGAERHAFRVVAG